MKVRLPGGNPPPTKVTSTKGPDSRPLAGRDQLERDLEVACCEVDGWGGCLRGCWMPDRFRVVDDFCG